MTREQLTQYIADPKALLHLNYEELKSLVMQYPYSTNLRLLLYEKSALENHKDAERHLQMVSTYTTDRKQLYKLVQRLQPIKVKQAEGEVLELAALSSIEKMLTEREAQKIETTVQVVEEKKALALPLLEDFNSATDRKKELEISAKLLSLNDHAEETESNFILADLIKKERVLDTTKVAEMNTTSEHIDFSKLQVLEKTTDASTPVVKKPVFDLEITNATVKGVDATKLAFEDLSVQEKISFSEWLNQFRAFSKINTEQPAHTLSQTIVESEALKPVVEETPKTQAVEATKYEIEPVKKEDKILNEALMAQMFGEANSVSDSLFLPTSPQNDLGIAAMFNSHAEIEDTDSDDISDVPIVERRTEPKVKKKREMHSLAAKSIAADEEITSETLADLLVMQGNNKKAINMYKRLSLQNPDKVHYFAEKIRELMND